LHSFVETDVASGVFVADVKERTRISPVAQIGGGIRHSITRDIALGLNVSMRYTGGFETGNNRSGNLGVAPISPYRIDDVRRTDLSATIRFQFRAGSPAPSCRDRRAWP
jgi:hypothetical protein